VLAWGGSVSVGVGVSVSVGVDTGVGVSMDSLERLRELRATHKLCCFVLAHLWACVLLSCAKMHLCPHNVDDAVSCMPTSVHAYCRRPPVCISVCVCVCALSQFERRCTSTTGVPNRPPLASHASSVVISWLNAHVASHPPLQSALHIVVIVHVASHPPLHSALPALCSS